MPISNIDLDDLIQMPEKFPTGAMRFILHTLLERDGKRIPRGSIDAKTRNWLVSGIVSILKKPESKIFPKLISILLNYPMFDEDIKEIVQSAFKY